ncbi:MAG: hypothetical protein ACFFAY_09650 [Promethearchaeota archaeon]
MSKLIRRLLTQLVMQYSNENEATAALSLDEEEQNLEMELSEPSISSENAKKVAVAAILASLSLAATPIAAFLPRIPGWDIAIIDPVSFFWIIAFLVGGLWIGLASAAVGMVGLFFFDPSVVGPIFKFEATFIMIIIPWAMVRYFGGERSGAYLGALREYGSSMLLATVIRLPVMVATNLIVVPLFFPGAFTVEQIISLAIWINSFQSIADAVIPWLVVHASPVFKRFGMW